MKLIKGLQRRRLMAIALAVVCVALASAVFWPTPNLKADYFGRNLGHTAYYQFCKGKKVLRNRAIFAFAIRQYSYLSNKVKSQNNNLIR